MRQKYHFIFPLVIVCFFCFMLLYILSASRTGLNQNHDQPVAERGQKPVSCEEENVETSCEGENNVTAADHLGSAGQAVAGPGFVLAAIGDIMIHSPQITAAYRGSEDRYDFQDNFLYVDPYFKKADFVAGNLETTLAGEEYGGYSGYPLFNSPPELADQLKKSGFDLLVTANNHSLDRGAAGLLNTLHHLEEAGLNFVGTARHWEEREKGYLLNRGGLKIAFFAYTYGTNGLPVPSGQDYLISLIDEQRMQEDILRAKNVYGADLIVFFLHWGNEYQRIPTNGQKELAVKLIDLGVNVIIGSHPHVVQPVEIVETEKGTGLVFYSLGNFISNQRDRYCDTGIIAYIKFQLDAETDVISIELLEIEPAWVHKSRKSGKWVYRVLPVREVLCTEQGQAIFNLSAADYQRLEEVLQDTEETIPGYFAAEMTFTVNRND